MRTRRDDMNLADFALLAPGKYKGHILDFKSHDSKPKKSTGETFPMYLIEVRVNWDAKGNQLPRPRRLFLDTWPNDAAAIKSSFIPDDVTLSNFTIAEESLSYWKKDSVLGKPCCVDLKHRSYKRRSGQTETDQTTGEDVVVFEEAVTHDLQRIYPHYEGVFLSKEQMDAIDSIERNSTEAESEEMPTVETDLPF